MDQLSNASFCKHHYHALFAEDMLKTNTFTLALLRPRVTHKVIRSNHALNGSRERPQSSLVFAARCFPHFHTLLYDRVAVQSCHAKTRGTWRSTVWRGVPRPLLAQGKSRNIAVFQSLALIFVPFKCEATFLRYHVAMYF
jgi:hypothetical protein